MGDSLWQYVFLNIEGEYIRSIRDIKVCRNGDIIGCGHTVKPDESYYGPLWMFRLSPTGELIWKRDFVYEAAIPPIYLIHALAEDPYGDIVATGLFGSYNPDGSYSGGVTLLKVNAQGCLGDNCTEPLIVVDTQNPSLQQFAQGNSFLKIIPNPSNSTARLHLPHMAQYAENAQLIISSYTGENLDTYNIPKQNPFFDLNTDNLTSGLYLITLIADGRHIATAKWAVAK